MSTVHVALRKGNRGQETRRSIKKGRDTRFPETLPFDKNIRKKPLKHSVLDPGVTG